VIDIIHGDALKQDIKNVDLIITSPPYGIGKEYEKKVGLAEYHAFLETHIKHMCKSLNENGVLAIQTGFYISDGSPIPIDYLVFGIMSKMLWFHRNRIVWTFNHGAHCRNRLSGRHEVVSIYSKSDKHQFNLDEIRIPQKYPNKKHYKGKKKGQLSGNPLGKNPADVWDIVNVKNNHPEKTAHPCQFPEELCSRLVRAYSSENDIVMDPFMGSGTVGAVCKKFNRKFIGIEKDGKYFEIAKDRISKT